MTAVLISLLVSLGIATGSNSEGQAPPSVVKTGPNSWTAAMTWSRNARPSCPPRLPSFGPWTRTRVTGGVRCGAAFATGRVRGQASFTATVHRADAVLTGGRR